MRVLVVSEKRILRELLAFFLEGRHLMDVVEAENAVDAIETLKKEDNAFDLIVCNYASAGPQLIKHVFSQGIQVHFMCTVETPPTGVFFEKHKSWFHWLSSGNLVVDINNTVKRLFNQSIKDNRPRNLQYARVKAQLLPVVNPLAGDLYVRLSETKFLRMIKKDDYFDQYDLDYFVNQKKMTYLYIRAEDTIPFTAKLNNIIYGKAQIVKPPSGHTNERMEQYEKTFEKPPEEAINPEVAPTEPEVNSEDARKELEEKKAALLKAKEELLAKRAEVERRAKIDALAKEVAHDLTQSLEKAVEMSAKIGFTAEVQEITKANVLQTIALVKKAPRLSEILNRVRQEKSKYISSHSMMLAHVSCALATQMDWTNDMTYQKLTLAAFLHDSHLHNQDLAAVQTIKELESKNQLFTMEEIREFKEHPMKAAETARTFEEVPPDVDVIIVQHHERPDGSGFPRGLTHSRISPLSAVFIVAHDLVRFLLEKEIIGSLNSAAIDEFIRTHAPKYPLGSFRKVLAAARTIQA